MGMGSGKEVRVVLLDVFATLAGGRSSGSSSSSSEDTMGSLSDGSRYLERWVLVDETIFELEFPKLDRVALTVAVSFMLVKPPPEAEALVRFSISAMLFKGLVA